MVAKDTVAMECCKWLLRKRFILGELVMVAKDTVAPECCKWLLWKRLYSPDSRF